MTYLWTVAVFIAFSLGLILGSYFERGYWADHAKWKGSVYYRGTFYKVSEEVDDDDDVD